jgi:hypothetical protein
MSILAIALNNSPDMWSVVPAPEDANVTFPGLAFA